MAQRARPVHSRGCIKAILPPLLALFGSILPAQVPMDLGDRQELLLERQVLRRRAGQGDYAPAPGLPPLAPMFPAEGRQQLGWDGQTAYQVDLRASGAITLSQGRRLNASTGEATWFWSRPQLLPIRKERDTDYTLLGAWQDALLFIQHQREDGKSKDPGATSGMDQTRQKLLRVDTITEEATPLFDIAPAQAGRFTAVFSADAFYVFMGSGLAVRVRTDREPWQATTLTENYWKDLRIPLRKETEGRLNPLIFGKAFLDASGKILIPAQADLPFDSVDIPKFWSELPEQEKEKGIKSGQWPPTPGREFGWKSEVYFLMFDPQSGGFSLADRATYEHLILQESPHSVIQRFFRRLTHVLYTTKEERIEILEGVVHVPSKAPSDVGAKPAPTVQGPSTLH